jgi:hypothetical protein
MAKYSSNSLLVFNEKLVKVVRVYENNIHDICTYEILIWIDNKTQLIFEDEVEVYQFPD